MTTIPVSQFRDDMAEFANKVAFAKQRICVERNHKPLFAVVPVNDMELLEMLEDHVDLHLAHQALKKDRFVSLDDLKKELGL